MLLYLLGCLVGAIAARVGVRNRRDHRPRAAFLLGPGRCIRERCWCGSALRRIRTGEIVCASSLADLLALEEGDAE